MSTLLNKSDPYTHASFTFTNRAVRAVWRITYLLLFRPSPRPFHTWRCFLLRCFGAKLGRNCHIYPSARIWAPWNLICEDTVAIADEAIIYNPYKVLLKSHSTVSQQAYLCGATHDYDAPSFPLTGKPIALEAYAWVCARANVQAGVTIGEGAVLALGAIATKDLAPWNVYAGIPAKKIKCRKRHVKSSTENR